MSEWSVHDEDRVLEEQKVFGAKERGPRGLRIMKTLRHPIPEWVTRGKTIRQLIKELETFEDQDLEVRMSLDYGDTHHVISIVQKTDGCCVLVNSEDYHQNGWQDFMDREEGN